MNAFLGKQNKAFCVRGLVIVCVFSINSLNFARAENIIPIPSTLNCSVGVRMNAPESATPYLSAHVGTCR